MAEQSAAYTSLESLTIQLISALTRCEPHSIESLSRSGETELFRMRSRLLEITSSLSGFAEIRASQTEMSPLDTDTREAFESAATALLKTARQFEKTAGRATSLAHGGSSYANANIQMCGVPPTTYRPPVLNYGKGQTS